jgi:lysyl-tRNA synthetase class 2
VTETDAAGIYVHIPFCLTRCGYCDFNAYAGLNELKPRYLAALLAEAELAAPGWDGTPFVSVFLGGGTPTTWGGQTIDWTPPYRRVTMRQAVLEATRDDPRGALGPEEIESAAGLLSAARRFGVERPERFEGKKGKLLAELFESVAESRFVQPTFLHEFPTEISPLSKRDAANPEWVDRFELYAGGMEIANGFSELNDPADQEQRFLDQARAKAGGDLEAMPFDSDYVEALRYGMPPTAGEGVGIDRLTMLLTDRHSIRDVILFPLLRPK